MKVFAIATLCSCALLAQEGPPNVMAVELSITDDKGGPIQFAQVELLRVLAGSTLLGRVDGGALRVLAPRDFPGESARLDDLPAGEFVLRIESDCQTLTLSEPFVLPAARAPRLKVRMQEGSVLQGVVTGPCGEPVAGALVSTEPGGVFVARDMRIQQVTQGRARTTTLASIRTAADGSFRIPRLAAGDYKLVAHHPDFAPATVLLPLAQCEKKALPAIALATGVFIAGTVTRGGRSVGGARVSLVAEHDALQPTAVAVNAITDANGGYRIAVRVPAGARYSLCAQLPEDGVFQRLAQIHETRRVVEAKAADSPQIEDLVLPDG